MKPKTILGIVLLVFAAGSIAYLVVTELRSGDNTPPSPEPGQPDADLPDDGIIVAYFYGGKRCPTCLKIEAYAEEAVTRGFPDAVANGRVVWRAVDTDMESNKHFIDRYDLFAKTLVVSRRAGGEEVTWESLGEIWTRVGDKDDFLAYVRGAVAECLEKS